MARSDARVSGKYACARKGAGSGSQDPSAASAIWEITGWQYTESSTDEKTATCQTQGQSIRVDGDYDITGSITGITNVDNPFRPDFAIGDNLDLFLFHREPSVGVTGLFDVIPVKILSIERGAQIDQPGPQNWTINWGLNVTPEQPVPLFDIVAPAL